jgi:hypothetical protein
MLDSYTFIEILLCVAVAILAWHELADLLVARREGKTRNVSRVVTHGSILALVLVYAILAWRHLPLEGHGPIEPFGAPTVPWAYLLLGGLLTLVAAFESVAMFRARATGSTQNRSRLVSYVVMFVVLVAMFGLAMLKWQHYLDRLDATASQTPLSPGGD